MREAELDGTAARPRRPVALSRSARDRNTVPDGGQAGARRQLALGEGQPEREVDAHDLAGRAHLRAEQGVGLGEPAERQDRLLDRHVVADAPAR